MMKLKIKIDMYKNMNFIFSLEKFQKNNTLVFLMPIKGHELNQVNQH